MNNLDGKEIVRMAKEMYGTSNITPEQLAYVTDMLTPSAYLLRNHTIKNRPMTFSIPGRNEEKSRSHRPWQIQIINDPHPDLAVIKSRQLGLSEMGVGKLLHFADTKSYDAVKALYAFPKFWGNTK